MKTGKRICIVVIAISMALVTMLNVFAVESAEELTAVESKTTGIYEEMASIESETTLLKAETSGFYEETTLPEATQPVITENFEEITMADISEIDKEQVAEKIYGIKFTAETVFMLLEGTAKLEIEVLTSPPENPLHTEFIEEESTEVLVGEADPDEQIIGYIGEEILVNQMSDIELNSGEVEESLELVWSSSDESVVGVGYSGMIYARGLGTAVVTASTADGFFSASCEVNVVEEMPEEKGEPVMPLGVAYTVTFSPSTSWATKPTHWYIEKSTDYSINFDVYKSDSNGNYNNNEGDISSLVNWTSSDTSVATVDIYGRITGHKNGSATITVTAKNGDTIYMYNPVHITVYTPYSSTRSGLAKTWVNQYRSTVADCHSDRLAGTIYPGTTLDLYGTSGDYILGSISGKTDKYLLWSDGVYDQSKGKITICEKGTDDKSRHKSVYTTDTLELALTSGVIATWSTSDPSIVKINNSDSATRAKITLNPVATGSVYITAKFLGRVDVIHVTTVTKYSESKMGLTTSWCGKYRCSHLKCTMTDRKEGDVAPEKLVTVYGESGEFYYVKVSGESSYTYLWKGGIELVTWKKQCELENITSDRIYYPQSIAMYGDYCYSFEIPEEIQDDDEYDHRLFRYDTNTGEFDKMEPDASVGELYHANDAEIVEFTVNGETTPYIFVAGYIEEDDNYIIKLGFNENKQYWEVARYKIEDRAITTIACISGGGTEPAVFLLKSGYSFYTVTIPADLQDESTLKPSEKFTISKSNIINAPSQGSYYDLQSKTLYVSFYSESNKNRIHAYKNITSETVGVISPTDWCEIENKSIPTFEIEGISFRRNSTDNRLWFSASEGGGQNGGIYVEYQPIKQ